MAYQSPFATAPQKQATGGYVSPFQKSKPVQVAPTPVLPTAPVVDKPTTTVAVKATGPRKTLLPKAAASIPDQGQTLSTPVTPLPKAPIKEAIVQSGKDALAVKPVQRDKSVQSLIEETYLSGVSQGTKALKFAVEKIAKEPTVLLGPLHYVPGVSKLNEPARKKVDQLNAEGKNPLASVASEAELRRASFITDSPEYQKASLTEKITKHLPETIYNLVPDVAGSAVPYLLNPTLGFAVAAGSTAEDVKNLAIENGVPEKEAEAIGLTTGLAVGALDRIVPDEIFGGNTVAKTTFAKGLFARLAQMTKTGLKEAATEVAQEDIQLAAEATFRDDLGWDEIKTRNVMAGLGGLFGGAGMKAVGDIAAQTPDVVYGQEAQAAESTPPEGTLPSSPSSPSSPPPSVSSEATPAIAAETKYQSPFAETKPVEVKPAEISSVETPAILLRDTPLHNRIMSELIFAEKGERIAVRNADSSGFTFSAKKSTFPSWIPADLRRKPLLDAVAAHIQNGTVPTKAAELRLYNVVANEMEAQNEVLNDEKYIASLRQEVIDPFATKEENALALAKFDEQYGKLKASQDGSSGPSGSSDEGVGATIQAETKPEEVAAEKAKPVRSTKAESRVLERLRQEVPELGEGVTYTVQSLKENTAKAVQLVEDDKTKAYRIAMGAEAAPEGQTQTAVSIALAEKALEDGNLELYGQLTRQRTLEQTRRGQEIVAEKGSVTDNSTSRYVKELVRQRLAKYDAGYLRGLSEKMLRKTKGSKAIATIDEEVSKIKQRIKSTKELDLDEAQKFLDSLACN